MFELIFCVWLAVLGPIAHAGAVNWVGRFDGASEVVPAP
jgi:hypothetical protein